MNKTINVVVDYTAKITGCVKYSFNEDLALEHFGVTDLTQIPAQDLKEFISTCVQDYVSCEGVDDDTPDHVKQFVESDDIFNYVIADDVHRNGPEVILDLTTVSFE